MADITPLVPIPRLQITERRAVPPPQNAAVPPPQNAAVPPPQNAAVPPPQNRAVPPAQNTAILLATAAAALLVEINRHQAIRNQIVATQMFIAHFPALQMMQNSLAQLLRNQDEQIERLRDLAMLAIGEPIRPNNIPMQPHNPPIQLNREPSPALAEPVQPNDDPSRALGEPIRADNERIQAIGNRNLGHSKKQIIASSIGATFGSLCLTGVAYQLYTHGVSKNEHLVGLGMLGLSALALVALSVNELFRLRKQTVQTRA